MAHNRDKTFIFCQSLAVGDARLDKFLSERMGPDVSRARIQYLIKAGAVTVDNEIKKPSYQLKPGQTIKVVCLPPQIPLIESEDVDFDLLYEDNSVLIVDKPPGLVVHPAAGHYSGTLVHGLLGKCSGLSSLGGSWRPGIVHRLDKDTSGVMVVAKGNRAHHLLAHQFKKER